MSDGMMSPLEVRIGLIRCKRQQGYGMVDEVGCYELLLALTLDSICEVVYLSSWVQEEIDGPGLLLLSLQ